MKQNSPVNNINPSVYVTDASAGSGKTYCLAKHYLKLLLGSNNQGEPLETILAITFTNKACRQMKERIIDFLKEIALGKVKDPLRSKASWAMDRIITSYNFFQVKTIDSFINTILLGCSYQIGLSSKFEIREDRKDYLALSLDSCIDKANHDGSVKKTFDDFLKQYIYIEAKSSWLPKNEITDLISSMFFYANVYGGLFEKFDLKELDLYKEKQELLKLYQKLLNQAPQGLNGVFLKALDKFCLENQEIFDFADIANKANFLKEDLPMNKGAKNYAQAEELWKKIRKRTTELAQVEAAAYFNCYIDIFNLVYEAFRKYAQKDDALFLEELNQQAEFLIQQNGVTVPELYYHLAGRLRHYLIDEFQDTSLLQWSNIFPMVEEAISTGGTLFYVGDKKQAIFRFRGGDETLFDKVKEHFKEYALEDFLKHNYRSAKEIVEFNNRVFSRENLGRFLAEQQDSIDNGLKYFNQEDISDILRIYSSPPQEFSNEKRGLVKVEYIGAKQVEERDALVKEKVLRVIDEALEKRGFDKKDIAILCRGNDEVELVSSWLIEENIPVESEKTLNIKNNKLIKELVAFLYFLNSPIDNLSFCAFILGDIFLSASGLNRSDMESFVFSLSSKFNRDESFYLYRHFRKAYPELWNKLFEEPFSEVGFTGLYELVADTLARLNVFKNFPGQQGFFMHFLQVIQDIEDERPGIFDFLEYFKGIDASKLFVNSSGSDAVRLMSIHKSKGLGFEIVIIPFLYLDVNELASQGKNKSVSYVVERKEKGLSLLRLDKKYALLSPLIKDKFREEYKKEFIDELNAIYVAFTRAKLELRIFISDGISRINNAARFLIPQDLNSYGLAQIKNKIASKDVKTLRIQPAKYWQWNDFLKDEFSSKELLERRRAILGGKILHEILAAVGNLDLCDKEQAIQNGLSRAKNLFPAVNDFSDYEKTVRQAIDAKEFRQFFYCGSCEVYQEKELVDRLGLTRRLDRFIVKQKEAWVIDYKSREESESVYAAQVGEYMAILKEIYPKLIIKGFLLYLDELRQEEING